MVPCPLCHLDRSVFQASYVNNTTAYNYQLYVSELKVTADRPTCMHTCTDVCMCVLIHTYLLPSSDISVSGSFCVKHAYILLF